MFILIILEYSENCNTLLINNDYYFSKNVKLGNESFDQAFNSQGVRHIAKNETVLVKS